MNTNPQAKRILCYGDSNTWGYIPGTSKRYSVTIRWPGILQRLLGDSYEIIEEGLNSRTTVIDDPKHEGKNGKAYLVPCLQSHDPIDLIILSLGTNDMKERFQKTPQQVADGIEEIIKLIQTTEYDHGKAPEILLMSPPLIDESVAGVKEKYLGAEEKSRQLGSLYQLLADKYSLQLIDLSKLVAPSKTDGYHFEPEAHKKVAEAVFTYVSKHGL